MAQIGAVHAFGESVIRYLTGAHAIERTTQASLPPERQTLPDCRFEQVSAAQINNNFSPAENLVTLYLFRIAMDRNLRSAADAQRPRDPVARPLSLELHYLAIAWADDAADEQTLMSWTMLALHRGALFDRSSLEPAALWSADETVQMLPSELSHENMMRIWEALQPDYRLSTSYVARTVRIETGMRENARPVIATRFDLTRHPEGSNA